MNCPFCQKSLPKSNPKACPHCKRDLSNYYRLQERKNGQAVLQAESRRPRSALSLLFLVVLVCCLIAAAVLLIPRLGGKSSSKGKDQGSAPTGTASQADEELTEPLDMEKVKAEIDSRAISDFVPSSEPTNYVKLTVTDFGEIVVRLRPDAAPISAQNFKDLVARHYYDGLSFHRVYPGFMIQGGAGEEKLTPIKGEFASNGVDNPLLHVRGVLSMARTTVKDSATSQFFLMHADNATLDGNYAAFGYIVAGLDTVDKICQIPLGDNPYNGEHSVPQVDVIIESAVFVEPAQ